MMIPNYDSKTFIVRRKAFLDWLSVNMNYGIKFIENNSKYIRDKFQARYEGLKVCEMHQKDDEESTSTKDEYYNGYFNPRWNTRRVLDTELRIEFDNEFRLKNIRAFWDTCINLKERGIHFATFYAIGMRSPHIVIYDFLPPGLEPEVAKKARIAFCRKVVPMNAIGYLDTGLLDTGHKVCLEFSKHWRYGTMLRLMFEEVPGVDR